MARYRPGAKHGEQSSLPSNPSSKH
jgi:hypothetical protein